MEFPLSSEILVAKPAMYLIFGLIGFAFGFVLEISGFGNSKKLAAQFYFTELTVLKVMFGAIITAMVLLFTTIGLGWLDYNQVWVNPTFLWSGIVGGLIMGVGFIVGGFCPGTSLVAAVTLKLDGVFFVLGVLAGIFLFGETVDFYPEFYNAGDFGRVTLMDFFNLPTGVVVLGVVLMALFMFWGGEHLERIFGGRNLKAEPRWRLAAAGLLVAGALGVLLIGEYDAADRWAKIGSEKETALAERSVQIHPGELLHSMGDNGLRLILLDVRPESDYNLFHLAGARNVPLATLGRAAPGLLLEAATNTVFVVISNDEAAATEAWKLLVANSFPNIYILEGGVNHWLATFAAENADIQPTPTPAPDQLAYRFPAALGARFEAAAPDPHAWELEYTPKIKLELKRDKSGGGCG